MGAEIISETGDDITFSGGQSLQSGTRNFFSGLHSTLELFLAGHDVKFGFR